MQILIIAVVVTLIAVFGSKKVLALIQATRMSLHERNMKRKAEKEVEKASKEKEQDVYNWQAYCKQQSGHAHASRTTNVRSGNSGNAGEIVLFDEESDGEDAVAATVIAAETV